MRVVENENALDCTSVPIGIYAETLKLGLDELIAKCWDAYVGRRTDCHKRGFLLGDFGYCPHLRPISDVEKFRVGLYRLA